MADNPWSEATTSKQLRYAKYRWHIGTLLSMAALFLSQVAFAANVKATYGTVATISAKAGEASKVAPIVPDENISVGDGYAVSVKSVRNNGLLATDPPRKEETQIVYALDYVEDYNELASKLEISASAAYQGVGGGVSARASLLRESELKKTHAYVLIKMSVITFRKSASYFKLNSLASSVITSEGPLSFYSKYGNAFATSVVYGGDLVAVMDFNLSSDKNREQTKINISANAGGASGDVDYASTITKLSTGMNVSVRYAQSGGWSGDPVAPGAAGNPSSGGVLVTTPDAFILRMRKFPDEVFQHPDSAKPLIAELKEYTVIDNWPPGKDIPLPNAGEERIENIARSYLFLKGELATATDLRRAGPALDQNSYSSAIEMEPYLTYSLNKSAILLDDVKTHLAPIGTTIIPSLHQYRVMRKLGLPPSVYQGNSTEGCDISELDTSWVENCLVGSANVLRGSIDDIKVDLYSGVHGELLGGYVMPSDFASDRSIPASAFGDKTYACVDQGGYPDPLTFAVQADICKTQNASGLAKAYARTTSSFAGKHCGYGAFALACVTLPTPNSETLPGLPTLPDPSVSVNGGKPVQAVLRPVRGYDYVASFPTDFSTAYPPSSDCAKSQERFGRYTLTVNQQSLDNKGWAPPIRVDGYWLQYETSVDLMQPVTMKDGFAPKDKQGSNYIGSISFGPVYCMK